VGDLDLDGRAAIVTGGASGIGRATVALLVAQGAQVMVADADRSALQSAVDEFGADRVDATLVDVTDPALVDKLVADTVAAYGRLDIAVNSAGVSGAYANTADQEVDEWRRVIDVNLTSVFLCVRAELRQMASQDPRGGAIVNVASAAGAMGVPGLSHYSASKHGVIGLTKSAALEYVRQDIRVNAVLPGTVRTPMLQRFAGGDEALDKMAKHASPNGRAAEPTEIAAAIAFLCHPTASYITGTCLPVDAGALAT
jgi:NAD(P)-dependent dehydrogenase (short-subunit alcohol dehydrogenase family)